jgi:hypothetical protein
MLRIVSPQLVRRNDADARDAITFSRHALQGTANTVLRGFLARRHAVRGFSSVKRLRVHARSLFRSSKKGCTRMSVKNAHMRQGVRDAA